MSRLTERIDAFQAAWLDLVGALEGTRWPRSLMLADLEYLADLARHPRRPEPLPGKRVLAERWGVSESHAHRVLRGWLSGLPDDYRESIRRPRNAVIAGKRSAMNHGGTTAEPRLNHAGTDERQQSGEAEPVLNHDGTTAEPPTRALLTPPPTSHLPTHTSGKPSTSVPPEVIEAWKAHHPRQWRKGPPKGWGVAARVAEYGTDTVLAVIDWAHTSSHRRATYLRENGYLGKTLFRVDNFASYAEMAQQAASQTTPEDHRKQAEHLLRTLHGRPAWDAAAEQHPELVAAIRDTGIARWRQSNDFQVKDWWKDFAERMANQRPQGANTGPFGRREDQGMPRAPRRAVGGLWAVERGVA